MFIVRRGNFSISRRNLGTWTWALRHRSSYSSYVGYVTANCHGNIWAASPPVFSICVFLHLLSVVSGQSFFFFSYCSFNWNNHWNLLQSATMPSRPMVVHGMMLSAYELNLRLGTVLSLASRSFRAKLKRKDESTKPCDIPRSPMWMVCKFMPRAEISAVSIKILNKCWHLNYYFRLHFLCCLKSHYFLV